LTLQLYQGVVIDVDIYEIEILGGKQKCPDVTIGAETKTPHVVKRMAQRSSRKLISERAGISLHQHIV